MRTLQGLIPRNLAIRKARTALTATGIALGVAAIVATAIMRESATRSLADMFDQAAGRADLAVASAAAGISGGEGFGAAALGRVQAVDGVEIAAPLLQITSLPAALLEEWEYSFIFGNFSGMVVYGLDPRASRAIGHYRLTVGEDLPAGGEAAQGAILLSESYARALDVRVGDTLELVTPGGQARFTVAGLLAGEGLARLNRGQVGLTNLETAWRVFERPGRLDQIDVVAAPGHDVEGLRTSLQAELGDNFRVFRPSSKGALMDQMLQSITAGMGFIGVLALVVGAFLVYNTFAMTVAERTRELGLLRALGAGRGQIAGLVLGEAALLGLAGAGLGLLLGLVMAAGMREVAGATVNSELDALVVLPSHVLSGLAVGLVTALLAALAPALRAGRLPVVQAVAGRRADNGNGRHWQTATGLGLVTPSLMATVAHEAGAIDPPFQLAFLALIGTLVGVGLLLPAAIPPLEGLAGRLLGMAGIEGRLGGRNLARSPGRAALTAGALMFGLASVVVIGAVVSSAVHVTQDYLDRTLAADLWVYAPQPMSPNLTAELESLPEVHLARPAASLPARFIPPDLSQAPAAIVFTAIDPERSRQLDFSFIEGTVSPDEAIERLAGGGAVFISSSLHEWYGLEPGDAIRLQTAEGPVDFAVAGVTFNSTASGYVVTGTWADARRYFHADRPDIFALNLAPGAEPEAVGALILERWGEAHNLRYETQDAFRVRTRQLAESYFALTNATVLVGVAVAALGVANTLLMNVLERRREIGMLRALGMGQGQVVRLILAEAAAMGVLGGAVGVAIGAWLSRFAVATSSSLSGFDLPYVFPVAAILTSGAIAAFVPLLAGLWPAWRGARANIVEAMRVE